MTRLQIRTNVRSNLSDSGITFFDDSSINDAIQDAYDDIASECCCIVKSAIINQVPNQPYYDFIALGITDYLGVIAIFNQSTNLWLRDDLNIRNFDSIRRDWEKWTGSAEFWAPHSLKYTAIAPNIAASAGEQFTVMYYAQAPQMTADSDVPLIATDMQQMLEMYATADQLENAEELTRAASFVRDYESDKKGYKERCHNLAKSQLLLRV